MFENFTQDYKQLLLRAEEAVKRNGKKNLESVDVIFEILNGPETAYKNIFAEVGIDAKVLFDVLQHPDFQPLLGDQGEYEGISDDLKNIIVSGVKIAAGSKKTKVDIDDFLLGLIKQNGWFSSFFRFIRADIEDFEKMVESHRNNVGGSEINTDPGVNPLHKIMNVLSQGLMSGQNIEQMGGVPGAQTPQTEGVTGDSKTPALDFFTEDLTRRATEGKIDPIIGRDVEIERLISILNRKTKNNPVLVGEPGVGKTAVVEGLARRIAAGEVPLAMQNKRLLTLDMGLMVAGTKYRGEFEVRMKQVIEEAGKLENEVILFIDEVHTLIGAGSGEGSLDAANILKPAMGRGEIRVIGATTTNEYGKHIEKDPALERRFQKVDVPEPSADLATDIIKGLRETFEEYHNLIISDEAIEEAVELSMRYVTDRQLPDKAIDLIDEACSTKSMKYQQPKKEHQKLKQDFDTLRAKIEQAIIDQKYQKAAEYKEKQIEIEKKLRESTGSFHIPRAKRFTIEAIDIQRMIHQTTGVPLKTLSTQEKKRIQNLQKHLGKFIIGQEEPIKVITDTIKRSQVGISNQNRPLGTFLFLGPTGVGKTELVKVLAKEYYGDEKAMIRIDMSEFSERSSASKLIGTTAGYVGYDDGGLLTDKVRQKPYSVVLFDEIEKGNFEVFNLLLQIMEDGFITDGKGRKINFRNTIIIMTSNIGSEEFNNNAAKIGFDTNEEDENEVINDFEGIKERVEGKMDEYFSPEFINRIDNTVVFHPLDTKTVKKIITLQLNDLGKRLAKSGASISWKPAVVNAILKETFNPEYGARPVRRFIQAHIETKLADIMLDAPQDSYEITYSKKEGFGVS